MLHTSSLSAAVICRLCTINAKEEFKKMSLNTGGKSQHGITSIGNYDTYSDNPKTVLSIKPHACIKPSCHLHLQPPQEMFSACSLCRFVAISSQITTHSSVLIEIR